MSINVTGHSRSKPVVVQKALFMWEIVASFSAPQMVLTLERLCRDVRVSLEESSSGTRLLQRYWKVQYQRLLWEEESIDASQRTLNFALSSKEGSRCWRNMFREEYPMYLARVYQGLGANNNAINAAKVFFKVKSANDIMSGEELARLQLTPREALQRRAAKNSASGEARGTSGVVVDTSSGCVDVCGDCSDADPDAADGDKRSRGGGKTRRRRGGEKQPSVATTSSFTLTREDYVGDRRLHKHKGKHRKGGTRKWGDFSYDDTYE